MLGVRSYRMHVYTRRTRLFVSVGTPTLIDPQREKRAIKNDEQLQRRVLLDTGMLRMGGRVCEARRVVRARARHDPNRTVDSWCAPAARGRLLTPKLPTVVLVAISEFPEGL